MDDVSLVTVDDDGIDIANLLVEGNLDKTGHIPLQGDELCFESTTCLEAQQNQLVMRLHGIIIIVIISAFR